jgi:hypothetical protein
MVNGYFLIADLLGFGAIIRNLDGNARAIRIAGWLSLVDKSARACSIEQIQLISDTVFAGTGDDQDGLIRLVRFAQTLLNQGIEQALPIRGAICHGEYSWGRLTYGPVVVSAHELEMSQNWVGVACQSNLPRTDSLWGLGSLICYPAPLKAGVVGLRPVVDWSVPVSQKFAAALCREGLTREGETLDWSFAEKLNNTLLFAAYRDVIARGENDPRNFYGLVPIEAISAYLDSTRVI